MWGGGGVAASIACSDIWNLDKLVYIIKVVIFLNERVCEGVCRVTYQNQKAQEQDWDGTLATKLKIPNYDGNESLSCVFSVCMSVCCRSWAYMPT